MRAPEPGFETAWVVSVLMGLGHFRAAYPLRDLTHENLIAYGSRRATPPAEYPIWKRIRRLYYLTSRIGGLPVVGHPLLHLALAMENIRPYYPRADQRRPNLAVKYLARLVRKRGLCAGLKAKVEGKPRLPVVNTFYATSIALDLLEAAIPENLLIICDADINRVWVPPDPRGSRIRYLAPCTQVKRRLIAYGVPDDRILLTGFPLPKENIGTETGLEVLKDDLFRRLLRLDPRDKFFSYHRASVLNWLDRREEPEKREGSLRLMFAVGGAGAQVEIAKSILKSLRRPIHEGRVSLTLSAGIQKRVFERLLRDLNDLDLGNEPGVSVIYDQDIGRYVDRFNLALRETDVLWTKPSELSFYCALGLPILIAPPIGTHEELNKRWLMDIHAGIIPPGPVAACGEWLFDLRDDGRLAEAAWDGFLKARKLGTFKIERLVRNGRFEEGRTPLEQ